MVIRKWNESKKDYDVVKIPDDWNVPIMSKDMGEIVNCVNCGCKMKFGDGFTSKRYHNVSGAAYSECKKCFDEYLPTYFKSRKDKDKDAIKAKIRQNLASRAYSSISLYRLTITATYRLYFPLIINGIRRRLYTRLWTKKN